MGAIRSYGLLRCWRVAPDGDGHMSVARHRFLFCRLEWLWSTDGWYAWYAGACSAHGSEHHEPARPSYRRGISERLAEEGARVVIAQRRLDKAQEAASAIADSGGQALAVRSDVTDRTQVDALMRSALDWTGRLDILVNKAGRPGSPSSARSWTSARICGTKSWTRISRACSWPARPPHVT